MYKKINVAILLISIFLVFIFIIFYIEHINSKRRENALIYYNQIIPIITLADVLDADLEYSDNYGNKGILKGGEENLTRRVSDDIRAYITKQNNHMYEYRIIESEKVLKCIGNFSRKTDDGEYFIEVLDIIGVNGSDIPGRIVYITDDKTEKVLYENDTLNLSMLFKDNGR